jgi:hypothetical protein
MYEFEQLSSRTSLRRIRELVEMDFREQIDNETARAIRDALGKGSLIWTAEHIRTTDGSGINITNPYLS